MTGKEYEIFVKNFLSELARHTRLPERNFLPEKQYTGFKRKWRIDISYSLEDLGFNFWVFVDCKNWNKVIDVNAVTWIHDAITDCGAQKGIVISTLGFTDPARDLAKKTGIGIATLSDKNELTIHNNADGKSPDALLPYSTTDRPKVLSGFIYPAQTIYQFLEHKIGKHSVQRLQSSDFWRFFSLQPEKLEVEINRFYQWIDEYNLLVTGGLPLQIDPACGSNLLYFKLSKFLAEQTYNG